MAADKVYTGFKSRLTRLVNKKDHKGVIALAAEFEAYYDSRNLPLPDAWARWERAADDARYVIAREGGSW